MSDNAKAAFHNLSAQDTLSILRTDPQQGLSAPEARQRLERYGPNRLRQAKGRSPWAILLDQFKSVVVILLAVAATAAFAFGELAEGIAIAAVIVINGAIGFFSEWQAIRSMEALQRMGRQQTRVLRDARQQAVAAEELVPGDLVYLEGGDLVPADLRLVEANALRVNEAPLTGESVPVDKALAPVAEDTPLAERLDMLYRGTTLTEGSAVGVVTATGMGTELGRIAALVEGAQEEATPLEQRLNALGRRLAWITIAVAILVAAAGLYAGQPVRLMIETSIALGVAAIPEGLPVVATIALARGMWLMARRQALINRLTAVETLGATHVICTDKTGTLTENRMVLARAVSTQGRSTWEEGRREDEGEGEALLQRILETGVLCSNAALGAEGEPDHGDPTEVALLQAGRGAELEREALLERLPEVREVPFDSQVMMMATYHRQDDGIRVAVKGAPQAILEACDRAAGGPDGEGDFPLADDDRAAWLERSENLADQGLRVLALAEKTVSSESDEPYQRLRLLGLVGLMDPPRADVAPAVEACRRAGIKVVMITGDQPATARAIARMTGLVDDPNAEAIHGRELVDPEQMSDAQRRRIRDTRVFARINPEQKLHLVQVFQEAGETVAMTGDGVNDTPALKKADIGIAMGKRGTDAARQASDMVLKDDAFPSIVAAVQQGRVIFANIRRSVMFMLCTNVAEILAVALASLAGAPIPLLPLQILYLNVLTDAWPALALGVGKGDPGVMDRPPRERDEAVLTRHHWGAVAGWSVVISACVLAGLALALIWAGMEQTQAVTVSFLTLGFAKLGFVFNLRDRGSTLLGNDVVRNPFVWLSIALCVVLLLAAVYLPGLNDLLRTVDPGPVGWGLVLGLAAIPLVIGQLIRAFQKGRKAGPTSTPPRTGTAFPPRESAAGR